VTPRAKSTDQLQRELAYYRWLATRTKSADRIHRALTAIAKRQRELAARQVSR